MEAILIWHGRISSCAPFPDHPQHPTIWFSGSSRNGIGPTVQAHPALDNSRRRRGGRLPQRREFRTRWHERTFTARRGMGILRLPRRIRLPFLRLPRLLRRFLRRSLQLLVLAGILRLLLLSLRLLSLQLRSLTQRDGDRCCAGPERANPVVRNYDEYGQEIQPSTAGAAPIYLLAFTDHAIRTAAAGAACHSRCPPRSAGGSTPSFSPWASTPSAGASIRGNKTRRNGYEAWTTGARLGPPCGLPGTTSRALPAAPA